MNQPPDGDIAVMIGAATAGVVLICCGLAIAFHQARRVGYQEAASRIRRELEMYSDQSYATYLDKVPGLMVAIQFAGHHERNYMADPTGIVRRPRRRTPQPGRVTAMAVPAMATATRTGRHHRG